MAIFGLFCFTPFKDRSIRSSDQEENKMLTALGLLLIEKLYTFRPYGVHRKAFTIIQIQFTLYY